MSESQFLSVDFFLPMVGVGVALLMPFLGIPMLIHAKIRKTKFNKLPDGYQTFALRRAIRVEGILGIGALALMVVLCIGSWVGYTTAKNNLTANIEQKYEPTALSMSEYNGSWVNVDITLPDGTSFTNSRVDIQDGGEPFIEDVWYHYNPKPAG